ncbi:winged helix-turn-helix domain-containing protein [Mesorhizobium sp. AR10]|uniref:winged helix-turn-helix domain-containing protein n=1 Tax=Mesorhizobium sp. AR10 TaxID=2865839 RepID=UPI00215FCAAA|nr:winged helix-turn-helix domain-containing protein [Mesorhizobium sp. AR10]UVK36827.1 winged helix-turn-helix domain-containing protein [Mesorhizobium sp. AR10]
MNPTTNADPKKKGPRWTNPRYQAATRKDTERAPDFHHKATHVLRSEGFSGPATSKVVGISLRAVRAYLSRPCEALEVERREITKRHRIEHHSRTRQSKAPFELWAYLRKAQVPMVTDLLGFDPWASDNGGASTRERISFYLMDGGWSQAEIARMLGISQQAVSKHARAIKEVVSIRLRRRTAMTTRRIVHS